MGFDVDVALDSVQHDEEASGYESDDSIDLESELSDLSDLDDLDDLDGAASQPTHPISERQPTTSVSSSFCIRDFLPSILQPFFSKPGPVTDDENYDDVALDTDQAPVESMSPEATKIATKIAKRKRKRERNREKRKVQRLQTQEQLKTKLKGIARRRAAEAKTLKPEDGFETKELPVNSGGWSGIRQTLDKFVPEMEELCGDDYDMQVVNWDGV